MRAQATAAVILALAAGSVDAVSFQVLHRIFTANMTGNSTQLGLSGGAGDAEALVPLVTAVSVFLAAMAAATGIVELATRRGVRATAAPALAVESALLAALVIAGDALVGRGSVTDHSTGFYVLLTLAVAAMGIQAATLTSALGTSLRTTFVSGMLLSLAQELVNTLTPPAAAGRSHLRDRLGLGTRRTSRSRLAFHGAVWASFVGGAAFGSWGENRWSTRALIVPFAAVVVAAVIDLRRPLHDP
jgi:uncharacterized membrane protein YoaK (UPF0700 family)